MAQSLSNEEQSLAAGYVLGDLTPEEEAQVAQLLSTNPAMQQEVEALQVSLQMMPHGLEPVMPPPHLEDAVLAAYGASTSGAVVAGEAGVREPVSEQMARVIRDRKRSWTKLIAILSIPALLLLALDNVRLRRQFSLVQRTDNADVASMLQRPKSRLVALQGEGSAGTLLFTPGQWEQVVVSIADLPPLPPDQIYRMWLSLERGEPFLCGEFTTDENGSVFVTLTPPEQLPEGVKAQGVFVTQAEVSAPLEPVGQPVVVGEIL